MKKINFIICICVFSILLSCNNISYIFKKLDNKVLSSNKTLYKEELNFEKILFNLKYHYKPLFKNDFTINIIINNDYKILFGKHYNNKHIFDNYKEVYITSSNEKDYSEFIKDIKALNIKKGAHGVDFGHIDIGSNYYSLELYSMNEYYPEFSCNYSVIKDKNMKRLENLIFNFLKNKKWEKYAMLESLKVFKLDNKKMILRQVEQLKKEGKKLN